MKVAHICEESNFLVLRSHLETLTKSLHRSGVENVFILIKSSVANSQLTPDKSLFIIEKRSGFDLGAILSLVKLVGQLKIDYLHAHDFLGQELAIRSSLFTFKRCLYQIHGKDDRSDWLAGLNRCVIFDSHYVSQQFLARRKINPSKICHIYPGVDEEKLEVYKDSAQRIKKREELGISKDALVVVSPANFVAEHDHDTLLKAFRKLYAKEFNGYLLIVGQGGLEAEIRQKIKEMGVEDKIKVIADVKKSVECIAVADVFISTAYKEEWPDFVFTAMALAKPVILSKVGKHTEIVKEGHNGFLAPCGFPERFENGVNRFFVNRSLLPQMSEKALAYYLQEFSLKCACDKLLRLYQSK